jgi:hypothetical protein
VTGAIPGNAQTRSQVRAERRERRMNYTIASLNDVNFGQVLTLDKNGNKYTVGLYNEETKEYTHKSFDSIGEAYTIFEKLSRCICFGEYSYSDRKAMIK